MKTLFSVAALAACAACGGSGFSTPVKSLFVTPNADGSIQQANAFLGGATTEDPVISALTGNGYSIHVGISPDNGIRGWAGVVPGAQVSAQPPSGTATMSGGFKVQSVEIFNATSNDIQTSGRFFDSGELDLVADFDAMTLTGARRPRVINTPTGPLAQTPINVAGTFNGTELSGTVTYDGVTGPLSGIIGGNEAVGVFHGNSATQLHAGGFIVN